MEFYLTSDETWKSRDCVEISTGGIKVETKRLKDLKNELERLKTLWEEASKDSKEKEGLKNRFLEIARQIGEMSIQKEKAEI